jgi:CO/xanthine dehydrogenase FAD-binding subunit
VSRPKKSPDLVDRFRFAGQIRRFRQQLTPNLCPKVRTALLWGLRVGSNVRQPAHQRGIEIDINTIKDIVRRPPERPGTLWRDGDAWLAGGTWLFSEQQPLVRRLVDLLPLGWHQIAATDAGLSIGATCTVRDLYEFDAPGDWRAGSLLQTSCEAFLASFKVWNSATVGGNICMSLPAGPMITMTVALEAVYTLWAPDGSERTVKAAEFVTGNHQNILAPGEVLRKIDIPISALCKRHVHRRFTLTKLGRSTIFMIGTQTSDAADLLLTITAATTHPILLAFESVPDADELQERIDRLPDEVWFDDANGAPDHRRHLAKHYAEEIRMELAAGGW